MSIDREALIEAAARAIEREIKKYPVPEHGAFRGPIGWGASAADLGRAALDASLPLIAEAIELQLGRYEIPGDPESFDPYWEGWDDGLSRAARTVESLQGHAVTRGKI